MVLGANCLAQDGLVIRTNGRQERPPDAKKIYFWACSAVEREFRISRPLRPQVTLVVGGDPHLFLFPLSTSEAASKGPRTLNYSFYRNPRLDDVLVRASQLSFRPERARLYQRAQALLADDLPWLPIYVRLVWGVARPEVRNLRLHPTGVHRLHAVSLEGVPGLLP